MLTLVLCLYKCMHSNPYIIPRWDDRYIFYKTRIAFQLKKPRQALGSDSITSSPRIMYYIFSKLIIRQTW